MKREYLIFSLPGVFFGVIVGWIIGSQQTVTPPAAAAPFAQSTPAAASSGPTSAPAPPPALDQARAAALEQQAAAAPKDARVREDLGNLYFDAQRFDDAARWYKAALALDPKNVSVSTDLAVAYYSTNQIDQALAQFDRSLALDPRHLKTLLNQGIVRWFGKRDLAGATESWQRVVEIAPTSEEGRAAAQGLEGLKAAQTGGRPGMAGG